LATLKDRVQRVPAIASVGTHLAWPATCLSRLRPIQAGKDVWTVNFIHGTVRRASVDDSPRAVSDDQIQGVPLMRVAACMPGTLKDLENVLSVVDLVEESFLVRIHVHA
jgi:hypothetical protein